MLLHKLEIKRNEIIRIVSEKKFIVKTITWQPKPKPNAKKIRKVGRKKWESEQQEQS